MNRRISKIDYYLGIALAVSKRSPCLRKQYGAVIVNNDEIISTGYNGNVRSYTNCCDVGKCARGPIEVKLNDGHISCLSVHAEQNAIISASRSEMLGATLYLAGRDLRTGEICDVVYPCKVCMGIIANAGISKVIYESRNHAYGHDVFYIGKDTERRG